MVWIALADIVLAVHAAWVLSFVLGPLWCWRRPKWRVPHLILMALTLSFMAFLGGCPLTDLENRLIARGHPDAAYPGGFIAHYLSLIVYWDIAPGTIGLAATLWFLGWGSAYGWLWSKERGR